MLFSWCVSVCVCVCVCVCDTLFMGMAAGVMYMMLWNDFSPIMCMYISYVGLCVHVFMNPMLNWLYVFFSDVLTYCVMLQAFICYCSYVSCLWCMCVVVVIVHWHCSAQLSMFNMEKLYRNKIIIIIIHFACWWNVKQPGKQKQNSCIAVMRSRRNVREWYVSLQERHWLSSIWLLFIFRKM